MLLVFLDLHIVYYLDLKPETVINFNNAPISVPDKQKTSLINFIKYIFIYCLIFELK
jgi:hypothetical protein